MLKCKQYISKMRIFAFILLLATLAFNLVSCNKNIDCYSLAESFREGFGMEGTIYSPRIPEGDGGYVSEDFYILMYSDENTHAEDYAILLSGRGDLPGEAAFFLAYSEWDAISIEEMLGARLDLIGSLFGKGEGSPAKGGFVLRSGKLVVMCATRDNERARSVVKMII